MDIHILAIGRNKDKAITSLCDEYIKRLKPHHNINVHEITPKGSQSESEALLAKVPDGACLVILDERGELPTTRKFAQWFGAQADTGTRTMAFCIGGADGHSQQLRDSAHKLLALSKLTFPHMLVRPILLEQLYRATMVLSGHPYHRD